MSSSASVTWTSRPKSKDPGWKYGQYAYENNRNSILCDFCGKISAGGINRHKQHLAGVSGNVTTCLKVPLQVREELKAYLEGNTKAKSDRLAHLAKQMEQNPWDDMVEDESVNVEDQGSERTEGLGRRTGRQSNKRPRNFGPMDSYYKPPPLLKGKGPAQTTLENRYKKEERNEVVEDISTWFYQAGIPFNTVKLPSFQRFVHRIGEFGRGLKAPSYHELREPLLKKAVGKTIKDMEGLKLGWKKYGCTIMTDGWTDRKSRSLMNFLVNCPDGTMFIKSIDASSKSHTAEFLLKEIEIVIDEIGEGNVVQVVTDNASANVAAGRILMEKRPQIFWTPCAAHCLDLMLEYIGKMKGVSSIITRARGVTRFLYKHTLLLSLMRKHIKGRDLVRAGLTRFATSFLTLQSLLINKIGLRKLFVSAEWNAGLWSRKREGMTVANTILSNAFWSGVTRALLASQPIVSVLRLVERDDKPSMGYVHQAMIMAREKVKESFKNDEKDYGPIVKIINDRWTDHMSHPLHLAGYFLNPSIYYTEFELGEERIEDYFNAFVNCLVKMVRDQDIQDKITDDIRAYRYASGSFGMDLAIRQRSKKSAIDWWDLHCRGMPELKCLALRILRLTCSASDCERNWSAFENVVARNALVNKKTQKQHGRRFVVVIFGSRGRNAFLTVEHYCCERPNPILQTIYLAIVGLTYFFIAKSSFRYIPGYYVSDMHRYTSLLAVGVGILLFLLTSFSDPGTVKAENVSQYLSAYPYDNVIYAEKECSTCKIPKPARSKHCGICDHCVARFDHHCGWMNNCIGEKNTRYFIAFLLWHFVLCLYGAIVLGLILAGQLRERKVIYILTAYYGVENTFFRLFPHVVQWFLGSYNTQILLIVFLLVVSLLLAGFFGYHAHLCLTNTTTNETFKWQDYISWKRKLNEAKASAAALKASIHAMNGEGKAAESKCKAFFRKSPLQNEVVVKNNIYDRGIIYNLHEVVVPLSERRSFFRRKSA